MEDGKLTEEEARACLSNLGRSARGLEYAYLCLSIPGQNLRDVSILCSYIYLQKLELPFNKIKDLSCVSHMPYLITLDASHNEISDFFGFKPPKNLKEVNFSHNQMSAMKDLSAYSSLRRLNLDYNMFHEIQGLENCVSLTHLSLAHNRISSIEGLGNVPLKEISLRGNQIQRIKNVSQLQTLQSFDLAFNKIQSLCGLKNLDLLGTIDLEGNQVSEIKEVSHLHDLPLLRTLNLKQNPVQDEPDYRLAIIFLLQRLTSLDQQEVTVEEKVSTVNKYDPPVEVTAARDHMMHLVYQLTQPQVIFDSTLADVDTPYPMLVLTGPQACGKRELAHKLCRDFCDFFAYGACHTTRSPYFGEVDGCDYHFVSEEDFHDMIRSGKFIETVRYDRHLYGLSREAIESAAREGLACCVHMELEGVLSLRNTYLEPRYVLLFPTDREAYMRRMQQRGLYSHAQIDAAMSRIHLYVQVHREQPGFFDNVIPCDDLQEAYKALSQVMREYLGLEELAEGGSVRATPDNTCSGTAGGSLVNCWAKIPSELSSKMPVRTAPQRSLVEIASIQRRQQLAQEALTGRSPGVITQLIHRFPLIAPAAVDAHTSSLPLQDPSENSSQESRASSGLSTHSSARVLSPEDLDGHLDMGEGIRDMPSLGEGLNLRDSLSLGNTADTPCAISRGSGLVSPAPATLTARPGSDAKPILPPIPSGRRTIEQPNP